MSFLTGTSMELIYSSKNVGTTNNTFTAERLLNDTTGMGAQACLPPYFFLPGQQGAGKSLKIIARGILAAASATQPTYTFSLRLGAIGSPSTAPIILGTGALATVSGVGTS